MNDFIIFLNGQYKTTELSFYKKLCRGKIKIAADGGLNFFKKSKTKPHILIGDLDSTKNLSDKYLAKIKLI
ncbi:MAG: thiamine diphosphokinase, partial [Candidatus Zixiibacteriota bacterium]